ncbi:MAG: bifunctional helix-turn-helix transcriptional regulator/GNAT family N-acetyltransferase [Bacteroidales bacterium]|nr:bifunctional helix-turn-helix transcriptional regulator/GNAT family N-acetyltransferase [Bacteroidales bacterium]
MEDVIGKLGFLAGGSRFRRIYEKMQIDGDKAYKESGLGFKSSWFPVYYVLSKSQQSQTVMEITDQIAFSHITVKNIINELNNEGLIKISPNPNDKRSKLISLSEKGQALLSQLRPIWFSFSSSLKNILTSGHPDIINILKRIDSELIKDPLNERVRRQTEKQVVILDYRPSLKEHFYELAGHWLLGLLKGKLEEEDKFTLNNPDIAYLQQGGFLFYAQYKEEIIGCVALKRLDEEAFEFAKLFVEPKYRNLGAASKLINRCISRCKENNARELWLQTTSSLREAHNLYYKLGFVDKDAPPQMTVLKRTEKIMCIEL